jgi:hypothetical protein
MRARKSALRGPAELIYEVHAFIPGRGFMAAFYRADSKERALERFKQEHPTGSAFWIAPSRGKAVSGPGPVKYKVWWKARGANWAPHLVFLFDTSDRLIGSVPEYPESITQDFWRHAISRVGNPQHRIEEVSQADASLIVSEILAAHAIERDALIEKWNQGKFDPSGAEDLPDMDWSELDRPGSGPGLEGLQDVPMPPDIPRPEMWDLGSVMRAVQSGFTFGLPFVMGESLFTPNAYWIGGQQYGALLLTVGPEHTPEMALLPDGWLRVNLYFEPGMVPQRTWLGPPNENGVVAVYAEIDPETVDWDQLNRGEKIRVPRGSL